MKKVLIVKTSPRKGGNSDLLAASFKDGVVAAGNEFTFTFSASGKYADSNDEFLQVIEGRNYRRFRRVSRM